MGLEVTISSIVGASPYDVYVCQPNGSGCFYINTIDTAPYVFEIPEPYNTELAYMLKIIDSDNCVISGVTSIS